MRRIFLIVALSLTVPALFGTVVIPISDAELYRRADVVVRGTVVSSTVVTDGYGRPETVTVISPVETVKGQLAGDLVLHQLGGELPDGRFLKLFGRPEYPIGREVLVFAIARPEGDYQTAELMLGKFEVWRDEENRRFAVPDFDRGIYDGVVIYRGVEEPSAHGSRDLESFLSFLREGATGVENVRRAPVGDLRPVSRDMEGGRIKPLWGNISNSLWRWNNGATAVFTRSGNANMTGGGNAETIAALATWTNHAQSTINYTDGAGSPNIINLNAASSPCGWNTCVPPSGGVVGCGGPGGGGTHTHRGDSYVTITSAHVEMRCFTNFNQYSSAVVQNILIHELGHTLGLGHSNQNFSAHDICTGDEAAAQMFSSVNGSITLGTDDSDAIRWIYGDGGASCAVLPPPTVASISPTSGAPAGNVLITINGTNFVPGSTVTVGGVAATSVTYVNANQLTARTPARAAGALYDVVVTTPNGSSTLVGGYMADFNDVPSSHIFHSFVERIFRNGITVGCGGGNYCPTDPVTRAQMAVFILRGAHGPSFLPPPATGTVFGDVPIGSFAAAWIEQLAAEGIAAGCGGGNYCPASPITRAQMAVFLLAGKYGSGYAPPAATGTMFLDVPIGSFAAAWIEELAREGITGGCGGGNYCPTGWTTRGQMAVFIATTFNLP